MKTEDYLPKNIEFNVIEQDVMPLSLGEFKSIEEVKDFINTNKIVGINQAMHVERYMDNFEKSEIRKRYSNILENILPEYEIIHLDKKTALLQAKEAEKTAGENLNAYNNQAQTLAKEVKRGLTDIELSDINTFRIPVKDLYYYYTFINNEFKLCAIRDIPVNERADLFNSTTRNEELFLNGEIKAQEGTEKQLSEVAQ